MNKFMVAIFLLAFDMRGFSKTDTNATVHVQISNSKIKPWLSFNDGEARKAFNTAVHHQALYFTPTLDIKPGYIKSWQWIKNENKYIFNIDDKLKYHDGREVTSYDFEFVLIKPFITPLPTTNEKAPLSFIKGIQKLRPGMKFRSGMAEGIKIVDKHKLEVFLESGHTRFLYSLGPLLPALAPTNEFNEDYYTFKGTPIGCGPYRLHYSDPKSSRVTLEKIDANIKGPKYIELYSEKIESQSKVDIAFGGGISTMRKYIKDHPGEYKIMLSKLPDSIQLLTFNFNNKAAQNSKFREAISYAFDKEKEIEDFQNQSATEQIIPVLSYGHFTKNPRYNLEKAKQVFRSLPKRIQDTEHVLSCHGSPNSEPGNYYLWVKHSLEAIGMKVKLVLSEESSAIPKQDAPTMFVFGRYVDGNPLTTFAFFLPGTSSETLESISGYKEAFANAETAFSTQERSKYIRDLSQIIEDKSVVIPLHQNYPKYYKSSRVSSVGDELNAWTISLQNIELK